MFGNKSNWIKNNKNNSVSMLHQSGWAYDEKVVMYPCLNGSFTAPGSIYLMLVVIRVKILILSLM